MYMRKIVIYFVSLRTNTGRVEHEDKKIPIGRHAKMDYFLCIANVYA